MKPIRDPATIEAPLDCLVKLRSLKKRGYVSKKRFVAKLRERYDLDDKWRSAWNTLANRHPNNPPRLQVQQEYIEYRASLANNRISGLMRKFDEAI